MVISSMSLLLLLVLSFNKEWIQKKVKLTFLKLFDNALSKYAILKELIGCNGCFGLLTKIEKESGTSFWCTFSA